MVLSIKFKQKRCQLNLCASYVTYVQYNTKSQQAGNPNSFLQRQSGGRGSGLSDRWIKRQRRGGMYLLQYMRTPIGALTSSCLLHKLFSHRGGKQKEKHVIFFFQKIYIYKQNKKKSLESMEDRRTPINYRPQKVWSPTFRQTRFNFRLPLVPKIE